MAFDGDSISFPRLGRTAAIEQFVEDVQDTVRGSEDYGADVQFQIDWAEAAHLPDDVDAFASKLLAQFSAHASANADAAA